MNLELESVEEDGVEIEFGEERRATLGWNGRPIRFEVTRRWATTPEADACDFDRVSKSQTAGK
jgi:hypothetical protein